MKFKSKAIAAFLAAILSISTFQSLQAETALFLSPTRIQLDDETKVGVINVTNMSDKVKAYSISIENLIMTAEGVTTQVDNFEFSAKRMVRFVPREFTLEPGERQSIRIMARVKPGTPDGDYHSHIHFLEDVAKSNELNKDRDGNTAKGKIEVQFAYSALVPVVVTHGKVSSTVGMKDPKIAWKDKATKLLSLAMQLTRSGNAQGTAYIDTIHVAADGTRTPLTARKTIQIYRELDERALKYDVTLPEGISGGSIELSLYAGAEDKKNPLAQETLSIPE